MNDAVLWSVGASEHKAVLELISCKSLISENQTTSTSRVRPSADLNSFIIIFAKNLIDEVQPKAYRTHNPEEILNTEWRSEFL
ncbi:hypothetical protein [Brasilonema bromeliae]|uniref:Uncharacterized protein n=1 Tax=Brasilonema bromeliae SPC951 TaxID=385972 RepID=A0ABX1PCB9_9CYAN|nr:hypothetical protein [Brasilonema bromeliae SPC951]